MSYNDGTQWYSCAIKIQETKGKADPIEAIKIDESDATEATIKDNEPSLDTTESPEVEEAEVKDVIMEETETIKGMHSAWLLNNSSSPTIQKGGRKTHAFKTETKRLLDIVANSLYSEKEVDHMLSISSLLYSLLCRIDLRAWAHFKRVGCVGKITISPVAPGTLGHCIGPWISYSYLRKPWKECHYYSR